MNPLVRDLYRRFLLVGKDYPLGLDYIKSRVKPAFFKNAHITDEEELMRAIYKGRWWVKELIGVIQLKKYRAMKARYGGPQAFEIDLLIADLNEKAKQKDLGIEEEKDKLKNGENLK